MAERITLTIDDQIRRMQDEVVKANEKYDTKIAVLEELMAKKRAMQNEELLKLFENSNRSYEEVAEFLKSGMTEEQLAKSAQKRRRRKPKKQV